MATLILSTVGKIFGPVGAAIGAVAGQVIDNALFKPKGRQGPRLTELAVQTSSYGTQLPKVFGTMRIAGCVIWSTDLIESRATSHNGKGQPSTTNYSYAASFAVALSGRPIIGVGRIWADGRLLRGAAGDFKTMTGYRLHLGSEEQLADPVIAAAEGGMAPAHRGIAYAVFENFPLGEYGNRLPSLTFEVIGDAAPVGIGAIAAELSDGTIAGDADLSGPDGPVLDGFSAYGDSVRGVAETLALAAQARFMPVGGHLLMTAASSVTATLADSGYGAGDTAGERGVRSTSAIERVPRTVSVAHYDPSRDFQTGLQRARRPGAGNRDERIDMPAALSAAAAKTLAEAALARAENERATRTLRLGWDALPIAPGACVAIEGAAGEGAAGIWRIARWTLETHILTLDCTQLAPSLPAATATPGRSLAATDEIAGPTILHAFEIPPLDDAVLAMPRLTIAAAGAMPGWRRAALLYSGDGGSSWTAAGSTAAPATIGTIAVIPGSAPATLFDDRSVLDVVLAHAGLALAGADDGALANGANVALAGDELLQFGRAMQIGPARWRLSRLLRGRRGTEAAIGGQSVGDRFVLLEADTLVAIDLPIASLDTEIRVLAAGVGDTGEPASAIVPLVGRSVLPPAPVHLRIDRLPDGGGSLRWTRRSRSGWRWIDRVDAPLAEEREEYRVTVSPAGGAARTATVTIPELLLSADDLAAGAVVRVAQRGSFGESPTATIDLLPT